jgi:hypothetical protein
MKSYSAQEFGEALSSGEELTLPTPPVTQTGMVDSEGSSSEEIRFAPGVQCTNWTNVPMSLIDTVDHLSNQRCGQYEYPYVRLHLKSPTELTDEARAIADILQQPGTTPRPTMLPARPVPTTPAAATPPVGRPAAPPVGRPAAPASRRLQPDARPGFNTPGPVKGCS